MKILLPIAVFFLISCGTGPVQPGANDSIVSKEIRMNSDSAKIPTDPIGKVDYEVSEINNSVLNGVLKRKGFDEEETPLGWLYAYFENDSTPDYIYSEENGELSSGQTIFYLADNKLIYVSQRFSHYGKDATGDINTQIKEPYYERHIYFSGDSPICDTIVKPDPSVVSRNYDFLKDLILAKKLLKKAKVTGPR